MTDFYANWKARLAGQTVKTYLQPQLEDAGYYRLPITNRKPNGQTDITGWVPVAMWVEGEEMTGLVGAGDEMREMTSTQLCGEQFWSWICRNPITYEVYDAVANHGAPWPDSPAEQLANTLPESGTGGESRGHAQRQRAAGGGQAPGLRDRGREDRQRARRRRHLRGERPEDGRAGARHRQPAG
jgi:hypothetical protein